jgi:hypothetical protein
LERSNKPIELSSEERRVVKYLEIVGMSSDVKQTEVEKLAKIYIGRPMSGNSDHNNLNTNFHTFHGSRQNKELLE